MPTKDATLKETGCFNNNHNNVTANIFISNPFFDKRDVVQVKYEMVRAVSNGEGNITEIASAYGFSRKSYYQASKAFELGGLYALAPQKKGPKRPSKLNSEVTEFINAFTEGHKNANSIEIADALEAEKGVRLHPRTIYRHLKKN